MHHFLFFADVVEQHIVCNSSWYNYTSVDNTVCYHIFMASFVCGYASRNHKRYDTIPPAFLPAISWTATSSTTASCATLAFETSCAATPSTSTASMTDRLWPDYLHHTLDGGLQENSLRPRHDILYEIVLCDGMLFANILRDTDVLRGIRQGDIPYNDTIYNA
eukprot:s1005_g22.t1